MKDRPSLSKTQIVLLGLHAALAVVFAIVGFLDKGGSDGWADLARLATALLAAIYLVATGTIAAVERFLISNEIARTTLSVIGPPLMIGVAILAITNV